MITVSNIVLWLHLLSAVGTFGVLLGALIASASEEGRQATVLAKGLKLTQGFLAGALLAGVVAYMLKMGESGGSLPPSVHAKIGVKFLILVGVGACVGMASGMLRKQKSDSAAMLSKIAALLVAAAALIGVWL